MREGSKGKRKYSRDVKSHCNDSINYPNMALIYKNVTFTFYLLRYDESVICNLLLPKLGKKMFSFDQISV